LKSGSGTRLLNVPTINNAPAPAAIILPCVDVLKNNRKISMWLFRIVVGGNYFKFNIFEKFLAF
jgi:hypothetical protein